MHSFLFLLRAFSCLSFARLAISSPLLETPRELLMDVNKAPFPVVNIIPEHPPAQSDTLGRWKELRSAEIERSRRAAIEQRSFEDAANKEMRRTDDLGERMSHLRKTMPLSA
mmetsp:Transcript_8611/g.24796  ORF Transcript_8611/g.24796 Transcript_8611/m.24796 type:complete len:112 (-) Transcript_8611:37-372(-)